MSKIRTLIIILLVISFNNKLQSNYSMEYQLEKQKYQESDAITPLMQAIIDKDINKIKNLIESGQDVNAVAYREQPSMGYPVLRYAIDTHSFEIVKILLGAKANVNVLTNSPIITSNDRANVRNISLLSHAINSHAPISIISELINYGAHLDGSQNFGVIGLL